MPDFVILILMLIFHNHVKKEVQWVVNTLLGSRVSLVRMLTRKH